MAPNSHINRTSKIKRRKCKQRQDVSTDSYSDDESSDIYDDDTLVDTVVSTSSVNADQSTTSSCANSHTESWHSLDDIVEDDMEIIEIAAMQLASIASVVQQRLPQKPKQQSQQHAAVSSSSSTPTTSRKRAYKSKTQQRKELGEKIFVYHRKGYYPANVVILGQDDMELGVCNSSGMLMKIDDDTGEALVYIQWESCRTREFVSIDSIDWISRDANTEQLDLKMNLRMAIDHTPQIATNDSGSIQFQEEAVQYSTTEQSQTVTSPVRALVATTTNTKTKTAPIKTTAKRKAPKAICRGYTSVNHHDDNDREVRSTYITQSKTVSLKRRCKLVVKYDYDTDDRDVFFENFVH